jgi:hypothetical protein
MAVPDEVIREMAGNPIEMNRILQEWMRLEGGPGPATERFVEQARVVFTAEEVKLANRRVIPGVFQIFAQDRRGAVREMDEHKNKKFCEITAVLGGIWRGMTAAEKEVYQEKRRVLLRCQKTIETMTRAEAWMSRTGVRRRASSKMPIEAVMANGAQIQKIREQRHELSTRRTYASSLSVVSSFIWRVRNPGTAQDDDWRVTPPLELVEVQSFFAALAHDSLNPRSYETVAGYKKALQNLEAEEAPEVQIFITRNWISFWQGLRKSFDQGHPFQKQEFTPEVLAQLLERAQDDPEFMCLLVLCGGHWLRISEALAVRANHYYALVEDGTTMSVLELPHSKTDPDDHGQQSRKVREPIDEFAYRYRDSVAESRGRDAFLFVNPATGTIRHREFYTKKLRTLLASCIVLDPESGQRRFLTAEEIARLGFHSFRITGAAGAARDNVPDYVIMTYGRWTSPAFLRYTRCRLQNAAVRIGVWRPGWAPARVAGAPLDAALTIEGLEGDDSACESYEAMGINSELILNALAAALAEGGDAARDAAMELAALNRGLYCVE